MRVLDEAKAAIARPAVQLRSAEMCSHGAFGLRHGFGGRQGAGLVALERIDLQVAEREFPAMFGPSHDKSTFLRWLIAWDQQEK